MNTPKIRFKGFTDDWEQRKLGEVAEYRNGKAHENEIDEDGEYIVVNSKFVSTNAETRKFSNAQNEPLYENEIAFVLSDVPNGRAIARTFLVDKSGKYTLNQRIAGITPHEDTDPYYLHIRMNRNAYFLKFDDGNKQTNLSIKDVLNYEDMYPSYKEQHKIGSYFRQLDHLITLHQRKCDETKQLKKFMLQKMFPKNGEKNPEIRFEGFTDDWEQRKVSDITNSYSGGTPKSGTSEYYDGNIPFIRSGEIYSDKTELFISELGMNYSSAKRVHIGDILYALYGATSGEVSRAKLDGAINQAILAIIPNQDINADFLVEWFRKEKDKIINTYLQGGQGNLSAQIIKELVVMIPSKEEQYKLGNYFTYINRLITLHQRKCEKLKELKKFMLQKMFV